MVIEQGKTYLFKYHDINVHSSIDWPSPVKHSVDFEAFIPADLDYVEGWGWFLMKLNYLNNLELDFLPENHEAFVQYFDEITLKGKYKWNFICELEKSYFVHDLPTVVGSSLNVWEHPKNRKWFLCENMGFGNNNYIDVEWTDWTKYELMTDYGAYILYYRIICDLVYHEVSKIGKPESIEDWRSLITFNIHKNNFLKFRDVLINKYHDAYLEEFLKLYTHD